MSTKILDNKKYGKVGEQLKENIKEGAKLSIASAIFTVYAYNDLKKELANIKELRFLFYMILFAYSLYRYQAYKGSFFRALAF